MNNIEKELLVNYIKTNIAPILTDFIDSDDIPNSVVLKANCEMTELNGHYDKEEFIPPKWLKKLEDTNKYSILVIDKIDSIPKEEQTKFIEILKYRKVSTFDLPKNTIIMITADEINKNTINEEVYSLVAHIKE